ncbi:MAG: sialate O-acetylesterase [Verrucomicrobia bacterium]|nr:sialate O-acetylesterase [Verrucomicrobiota bacterium]
MKKYRAAFSRQKIKSFLLASVVASAFPAAADVRLPRIFSDSMMLQRNMPVRVWGWAEPGEEVTASLAGKSAATRTNENGQWSVELPAMKAGENLELAVKGKNSLALKNVIIGDIWVCSGQSNMEWTLGQCLGAADDIKAADLPKIRQIKFTKTQSAQPETDAPVSTPWQECSPATAAGFTGVGFYFAREILAKTGVPIGLVYSNWGGTQIEPWTALEGLGLVAELKADFESVKDPQKAYRAQLPAALTQLESWIAQAKASLANGTAIPTAPAIPAGPAKKGAWSGMYNAMIHPLVRFPIKGAIWYQGESNGSEGETYYHKMRALIGGWRKNWGQGDFPFYFVQLASYQAVSQNPAGGNGWARLREAQFKSLSVPNTGMAVITDTVPLAQAGDIHPKNKYDVGLRLALWALGRDYAQKGVVVSGPLFKSMKVEGGKARLEFDQLGSGLMIGKKDGRSLAVEDKEGKLARFAIAGADKKWAWAEAVIEKDTVVVSSPEVAVPAAVRYGFEMNPTGANLYNREGLPASPFRTDAW